MTLAALLQLAQEMYEKPSRMRYTSDVDAICAAVLALLAESAPCGFDTPTAVAGGVSVPVTWCDAIVSADDARTMARMLFAVADEAEAP